MKRARLERLTSSFTIEGGRIRTEDLELVTDDYQVTGRGEMSHDQSVRLDVDVLFTAQGIHKMLVFSAVPERLRKGARLPSIPVTVRGPLSAPAFHADVRAVPLATVRGLAGLPARAKDIATGTAGLARDAAGAAGGLLKRRGRGPSESPEPAPTPEAIEEP